MPDISTNLPRQAWWRVQRLTLQVTAVSVAMSVIMTIIIMDTFSAGLNFQGLICAVLMPILLGGPMMFYLAMQREQLRHANEQLQVLASTDWLTRCLNRGAFTRAVETDLARPVAGTGALLIIDADAFKQVNDRFGHQSGDDALVLIAEAIRASVHDTDFVGRLGGEEFAVYLPDADLAAADAAAERIRQAIASLAFAPHGTRYPLSASLGGATFTRPADFGTLYKLADERLYAAKRNGRDCIIVNEAA